VISEYATETVTLKRWTNDNAANEPSFTDVSIKARVEHKRRMTYDQSGQLVLSETQVFTEVLVVPKDRILVDGVIWPIKSAAPQKDTDGAVLWYEVRL
jgi:hypothetical protein